MFSEHAANYVVMMLVVTTAGLCGASGSKPRELWRLGEHDGSWREFRSYYAWEYGREPWVAASPDMDFATHTWTYRVPGPGLQKRLPFPCEICTRYENGSMPDNEIVTGLRIVWNETLATNRLFRVDCASFFHWLGNGERGIELQLSDGRKKVFNLPAGQAESKKGCFAMEGVIPVKAGENEVTVRIVTLAKHYRIRFDSISLHETDAVPSFESILSAKTDVFSGIAHPGETARAVFTLANAAEGTGTYAVYDYRTNEVARGVLTVADGCGTVLLPTDRKGWFRVAATCGGARAETAYAVVEPPNDEFVGDSRFGCHAIGGDGYFLRDTAFGRERAALKARRAYLGGAKWARIHYLSWACREPVRGTYVWEDLDRRVALAERNKLRVMFNVVEVPKWNSPTNDTALTCCGAQRFKMHPPVDHVAWADFVTELVTRYRGRVEDFEIGNEPGFTSAFWMTGSPADFAAYLKTAYEAAHRANPSCRIYPGAPLDVVFHEAVLKANGGKPCYDVLSGHYLGNGQRFGTKTDGWLSLNAAYGMPREMINSEDMNWRIERRFGQRAVAAHMVKLHVRDAVRGVKRTFAFQVFDDLAGHYSFFDVFDAPCVTFPAYRTMTHRLEYAKYVGDLSTAEYEAYVFDRRGTPVTVFWNGLKVPYRARLPLGVRTATSVDEMDNETSVTAEADGAFVLPCGDLPRYVEGGDWPSLRAALAAHPKDPFAGRGGNPLGWNMATKRLETPRTFRGRHFVPVAKDVPVRYGETYVFAATIRGKGELNGIYAIRDKDGKELFPCRQGLNCLVRRAGEGGWRTVHESVSVTQEDAATLQLTLVPNFYAQDAGALEVRDVTVARISETHSVSKALHRGTFGRADCGAPIKIPGAAARVRLGDDGLCVAFEVEDDAYDPPTSMEGAYMKDSVQFAVDPKNDGADKTEFALGCLADGTPFLYKSRNYTTPELPDDITRRGRIASAKVDFRRTAVGWRIEARIPINEVYPLKAGAKEFGFNYLVNDCDGGQRTYREWTPGIGGVKRSSEFGCLRSSDGLNVRTGAKIVFLGDSITHQGRYLRFIDEHLVNDRPADRIRTYSAGVGGDRADLCLDRLARDVDRRQPDLIAVMLGMNDCMNEGAATNYEANVARLATRLKASNPQARFIWMTPSPYDSGVSLSADRLGPHPERAERLRHYAAFLRAWQRAHGGLLVDFNAAMEEFHRKVRAVDPTFTLCGKDRVHPEDIGGYFMARVFLRDVGLLPWTVPRSIADLKADFEAWRTRNDTPAGRLVVERNREQAEFRTLHMIRWQLETLERRNADDFAALKALEKSFNGRKGQFEDRVRRYLKEWPRVHETDRRLDEMWTRAYAQSSTRYDL